MSAGTEQQERFPRALTPGYFRPDDLDFAQRVEMTAQLARQLRFHDLNHQEDGDWSALFSNDSTLMMARIAAADLWPQQQGFTADAETAPLPQLARQVLALAGQLDFWWRSLDQAHAAPRQLRDRIERHIRQQLAADLRWVERRFLLADAPPSQRLPGPVERELSALWHAGIGEEAADAGAERDHRERLRERFFAFLSAAEDVSRLARELLPESLATGRHEPAAALLIAFLQLCEMAQQEVNRLPARHTAFYLRDCLGFQPRPAQADRVHLACERDLRMAGDVQLLAGTAFDAGKDVAGRPLRFVSEEALTVTPLRVAALHTLRQEHDPLIAPECHLGYVTRSKLACPAPDGRRVWPLFGASGGADAEDARIGLAIASPLLLLGEGEREIRLRLRQAHAGPGPQLLALRDAVLQARTPQAQREAFGGLLPAWLMAVSDSQERQAHENGTPIPGDLGAQDWQRLRAAVDALPGGELPPPFAGHEPPRRSRVFSRLLQGALRLSLSSASGWLSVDCRLERVDRPATGRAPGTVAGCDLALRVRLKPEMPAIVGCDPAVHGAEWPTRLPVLRLELSTQGRLYPYSLLARLSLAAVELQVTATGLRQLHLHNNLGRLDATKPFMPFGPLPSVASSVVIGSAEAARKALDRLWLDIEWGELPQEAGGFDAVYAGYGGPAGAALRQGGFSSASSWLRDGRWQACSTLPGDEQLFRLDERSRVLQAARRIEMDPRSLRQLSRASTEDWQRMPQPRNGLCRLQLASPPQAFGHALYPVELAATLAANARSRRPRPLPGAPYTPVIARLSLSYEASSVISLDRDDEPAEGLDGERLFHLHPLGLQPLRSAATGGGHLLLPSLGEGGHLYIGLGGGNDASGLLTLLFQLHEPLAGSAAGDASRPSLQWATLAGDEWRPLPPNRVLGDTTHGGLTTGIVTLDLPGDMDTAHSIMPAGLYWLRLSANAAFERFGRLVSVRTQGLRLARELQPADMPRGKLAPPAPPQPLADGAIARPVASLPGLAAVAQVGRSFGLRCEEDERALITRAGERLQHKGRSSLAWDVERLLLDRFPDICKVRCLPAAQGDGRVTVVVVPAQPRNQPSLACAAPRFNAVDLARMAQALREVGSPFADFQVRNPAYDLLQLRATIGLRTGAHEGATLRRVNDTVVRMLSPWFDEGYPLRFDWLVRSEDLEARIRQLDGVDTVSRLSLLTLTCDDDGAYRLHDTALAPLGPEPPGQDGDRPARGAAHAHARLPWSLALPLPQHILSAAHDPAGPRAAQPTGVAQLAVGATFVIGGSPA